VFNGEGYRKLWARLRHQGIRTSKQRVLQLLRENQLLSPARHPEPVRSNPHEGTIQATRFEALQPIRRGAKEQFGAFSGGTPAGLRLRHDHGSVYVSDDFQSEIRFL